MARAALNWSLQRLSEVAGVHRNTISNFETGRYAGEPATLEAIRIALEAAGVEFTNGEQPGVRMRSRGATRTKAAKK
jgi:transcriptional regulator with XRE-family HTH domain